MVLKWKMIINLDIDSVNVRINTVDALQRNILDQ